MYECEWERLVTTDPQTKRFLRPFLLTFYGIKHTRSENEMIKHTRNGDLQDRSNFREYRSQLVGYMGVTLNQTKHIDMFGLIKCDPHIPNQLTSIFSEIAPIFKNIDISREDLSGQMKIFAKENGHLK